MYYFLIHCKTIYPPALSLPYLLCIHLYIIKLFASCASSCLHPVLALVVVGYCGCFTSRCPYFLSSLDGNLYSPFPDFCNSLDTFFSATLELKYGEHCSYWVYFQVAVSKCSTDH